MRSSFFTREAQLVISHFVAMRGFGSSFSGLGFGIVTQRWQLGQSN
jgi:hypothetical protein